MYKKFIKGSYNEILDVLNCLRVGVYITDGKGKTMLLNDESCRTGGLTREETLGRTMKELEEEGFVENSVTLKVLESGHEEDIIQNLGDGGKVFVTGRPLYYNGKIDLVVCTERDITETFTLKELLERSSKDNEKTRKEIEYLKRQNIVMWGNVIAEDDETKRLVEKALRVAALDTTVLLTGESGTGKEVYANFIYQNSSRVGKPFIKVNCAAIPENLIESELFGYEGGAFTGADKNGKIGLFEMASNGTLFLDEIGEMPMHLQPKLLRAIQEKEVMRVGGTHTIPVDIRLITATNRDLKRAVEEGHFRQDLYYRLNIMPIEITPLRGRKKDIKALAVYFVEQFNKTYKMNKVITESAVKTLQNYNWPGNIRELENILERIMISFDGETITKFQVERAIGIQEKPVLHEKITLGESSIQEMLDSYEKQILEEALEKYGRASAVARALRINKSTLSRRMKKYGLGE